ncbi:DeoR/GlpR family DNA-binding transcription regulator [Pararhizobium haloflavum]|uniref:DeoR/GlpR family DNA-binding transcription regulator n=1 Tax=Pararhizobium haloflavum TaxID=2037914 RepID=UPI000C1765A5|nr:DeoR/GlpR family DNA-binding transcription regulator [Pararhizobium haloflavum]
MSRLGKLERRDRILGQLRLSPHVRISELADQFGVSTETVRRDVDALSRQGLVARAYGGAAASTVGFQPPFGERNQRLVDERARIAGRAASLVKPGEVVMIDAGSTTTQFAKALAMLNVPLTVLTNSLSVATTLGQQPTIDMIICPGDFVASEAAVYGHETEAFLRRHHADHAFIGASGIAEAGIMDANRPASAIKRVMIAQARQTTLLIDRSKFEKSYLSIICPLSDLDAVITDSPPGRMLEQALGASGVTLHVAL